MLVATRLFSFYFVSAGAMFQVCIRIFRSSPTVNRTYFRHTTAACVVIELSFADRQPD
jgi:hypothetical protein